MNSREAFEKWFLENIDEDEQFEMIDVDLYSTSHVQAAWHSWQAAEAHYKTKESKLDGIDSKLLVESIIEYINDAFDNDSDQPRTRSEIIELVLSGRDLALGWMISHD